MCCYRHLWINWFRNLQASIRLRRQYKYFKLTICGECKDEGGGGGGKKSLDKVFSSKTFAFKHISIGAFGAKTQRGILSLSLSFNQLVYSCNISDINYQRQAFLFPKKKKKLAKPTFIKFQPQLVSCIIICVIYTFEYFFPGNNNG